MNAKPIYIITAAVLALSAWLGRYEIVGAGGGEWPGYAYRLDRWTGAIMVAGPRGTRALSPLESPEQQEQARGKAQGASNPFDQFDK